MNLFSKRSSKVILFLLLTSFFSAFSQTRSIDSLLNRTKTGKEDSAQVLNYAALCRAYWEAGEYKLAETTARKGITLGNKLNYQKGLVKCYKNLGSVFLLQSLLDSSYVYCDKALLLAEKTNDQFEIANCLGNLGNIYYFKSDYNNALIYYQKQLKLVQASGDKKGLSNCYGNIGNVYNYQNNYPLALDYFMKQLRIVEDMNDKIGMSASYMNIGMIYKEFRKPENAMDYIQRSLKIDEELGNKLGIGLNCLNIGLLYYDMRKFDESEKWYNKSLKIANEMGDQATMAKNYVNLGVLYSAKDLDKGLAYYTKACEIFKLTQDDYGLASVYTDIGNSCYNRGKFSEGMNWYKKALALSEKMESLEVMSSVYDAMATGYYNLKDYKNAYDFHRKFKKMNDSIFNVENSKILSDVKTNFAVEKKKIEVMASEKAEKDKLKAISEKEKEQHRLIIIGVAFVLIIVLIFAIIIFNRFRHSQKQKQLIEQKEKETQLQKKLIEEKNKEITDSITYAKRLQQAILPPEKLIRTHLPDSFVFYRPKDIVAGDFYWMEYLPTEGLILIAAADCTGHGVPGAMVSIVCSDALNRTIKEFKITEPGKILDKTRQLVLETFSKSESTVKDGMDISLCSINTATRELIWSGANNPLWYIANSEFKEIKAHKQPVGVTETPTAFPSHHLQLAKGDMIFLITDGFADQFGGPKGKKFKYKQLQEVLLSNSGKDMNSQSKSLEIIFNEWKGFLEQVDDVCVIGIKLS